MADAIRAAAMSIVIAEEAARGWTATPLGSTRAEREHGCDLLSTPPEGGEPNPIEVKGWGEPFLGPTGGFLYHQDIRLSQFEAAERNPSYRVEIVANLTAHLAGDGDYERLTLTADQIRATAIPRLYDVPLATLVDQIRTGPPPGHPD
jgi:hypothetical protein